MEQSTKVSKRSWRAAAREFSSRIEQWLKDREGAVILGIALVSSIMAYIFMPSQKVHTGLAPLLSCAIFALGVGVAGKRWRLREQHTITKLNDHAAEHMKNQGLSLGIPSTFLCGGEAYKLVVNEVTKNTKAVFGNERREMTYSAEGAMTYSAKNYWTGRPYEKSVPVRIKKLSGCYAPCAGL